MSANMKNPYVRRDWSEAEHAELWRLKCEGVPIVEIARRIGRANSSCNGRLAQCDENGNFISRADFAVFRSTPDQDKIMAEMSAQGIGGRAIADRLGIPVKQVWRRLRTLAGHSAENTSEPVAIGYPATPKDPGMRRCLPCMARGRNTMFMSPHAGIRICKTCRERARETDSPYNPGIVGAV